MLDDWRADWNRSIELMRAGDRWLRGYDSSDPAIALVHLEALTETPFEVKPCRNIRQEKTRNYRRKAWQWHPPSLRTPTCKS